MRARWTRGLTAVLTAAFIILEHFQIATIGTYPLTLGFFLGVALVIVSCRSLPLGVVVGLLGVVIVPNAVAAVVWPAVGETQRDYFQTFALFAAGGIILAMSRARVDNSARAGMLAGSYAALWVVVPLSLVQVLSGSRGVTTFFNVFGRHQYLYEYDPYLQYNPIPRAEAFYLEPSYAAFVIGTLLVVLQASRHRVVSSWILAILGLVAVRSATGLLLFGVILLVFLAVSRVRGKGVLVVALLAVGVWVGPYLSSRLDSAASVGSSANYRLVGPLRIMSDTLTKFPLGHPFGSLTSTVAGYGILNGTTTGDSLDNGFYVIVFYFGWIGLVGVFVLLVAAGLAVHSALVSRNHSRAITVVWAIGSLFFSGGIMLPEYLLTLWILMTTSRPASRSGMDTIIGTEAAPQHRDGHVPRPERPAADRRLGHGHPARS